MTPNNSSSYEQLLKLAHEGAIEQENYGLNWFQTSEASSEIEALREIVIAIHADADHCEVLTVA